MSELLAIADVWNWGQETSEAGHGNVGDNMNTRDVTALQTIMSTGQGISYAGPQSRAECGACRRLAVTPGWPSNCSYSHC